jgi:hypothetical protein
VSREVIAGLLIAGLTAEELISQRVGGRLSVVRDAVALPVRVGVGVGVVHVMVTAPLLP